MRSSSFDKTDRFEIGRYDITSAGSRSLFFTMLFITFGISLGACSTFHYRRWVSDWPRQCSDNGVYSIALCVCRFSSNSLQCTSISLTYLGLHSCMQIKVTTIALTLAEVNRHFVLGYTYFNVCINTDIYTPCHIWCIYGLYASRLVLVVWTRTVWVKKIPPYGFLTFSQNGWEFLINFLHTYHVIISTL